MATSPRDLKTPEAPEESFVHNLRYGDGELLKDGTSDHPGGRTLKGRYIVRVGWDDVRGWFSEVSTLSPAPLLTVPTQEKVNVRRREEH